MTVTCPRIVIGGTSSGIGKTSVSLALAYAFRKRGLKVQAFKVGPDFLDPTYLSIASARDCFNLDGWMSGREYVCNLFAQEAADADIAVIEGVMGLFDGADSRTSEGSTSEIARWLSSPVLLVVNAGGMARSIAAVVKGFSEFEPGVRITGVITNHSGTRRHRDWLSDSLDSASLPPLVGAIPKGAFPELRSRHLGLVTADKEGFNEVILEKLAEAIEENVSLDQILKQAKNAPPLEFPVTMRKIQANEKRVRIGMAYDGAFHFYYPDNLHGLEKLGCELVRFSPINDRKLPEDLNGIYLGGGYPEEHAASLSANKEMLEQIRAFADSGRPVYAECGGLIYLSEGLETLDGKRYKLAGVLPAHVKMRKSFSSLGYVEATLTADTILGSSGEKIRGHRFHYSELVENPTDVSGWKTVYSLKRRRSDEILHEGYLHKKVLATYVHAHLASRPSTLKKFIYSCEQN
jgi:cobyrinic acid a,c-diamide synthase